MVSSESDPESYKGTIDQSVEYYKKKTGKNITTIETFREFIDNSYPLFCKEKPYFMTLCANFTSDTIMRGENVEETKSMLELESYEKYNIFHLLVDGKPEALRPCLIALYKNKVVSIDEITHLLNICHPYAEHDKEKSILSILAQKKPGLIIEEKKKKNKWIQTVSSEQVTEWLSLSEKTAAIKIQNAFRLFYKKSQQNSVNKELSIEVSCPQTKIP
jgi:hypothetical protein